MKILLVEDNEENRDALSRRLARTIPTCQATFTDEGHLMGLRHTREAIQAIRGTTSA